MRCNVDDAMSVLARNVLVQARLSVIILYRREKRIAAVKYRRG